MQIVPGQRLRDSSYGGVVDVLNVCTFHLPIASLAEKRQEIFVPNQDDDPILVVRYTLDMLVVMVLEFTAKCDDGE